MSNIKISALGSASALSGTEEVPIVQSGSTVKTTTQDIANLGGGGLGYKVYTALLTQSGTDAPVATVLQNTIGDTIIWSRSDVGFYTGVSALNVFTSKTIAIPFGDSNNNTFQPFGIDPITGKITTFYQILPSPPDSVLIFTWNLDNAAIEWSACNANKSAYVEIRIYS